MKSLEIPEVNAKVTFAWMNVAQQRKMCDEDLAAMVAKFHPDFIFEEVSGAANFDDWTPPCQAAQPAWVPPEVVMAFESEIDEMKEQLAGYRVAKKENAGNELAAGYFESMEKVLADEIAKKEATLRDAVIPQWIAKFVYDKIIACDCCSATLGKVPAVRILFFGLPEHKTGLVKAMGGLKAHVVTEEKQLAVVH